MSACRTPHLGQISARASMSAPQAKQRLLVVGAVDMRVKSASATCSNGSRSRRLLERCLKLFDRVRQLLLQVRGQLLLLGNFLADLWLEIAHELEKFLLECLHAISRNFIERSAIG